MADKTERRLTRDLMFEAVPCRELAPSQLWERSDTYEFFCQHLCGSRNLILWGYVAISVGGEAATVAKRDSRMTREIMLVPFPLACSRLLMSFLTFQISTFFSASFCGGSAAIVAAAAGGGAGRRWRAGENRGSRFEGSGYAWKSGAVCARVSDEGSGGRGGLLCAVKS